MTAMLDWRPVRRRIEVSCEGLGEFVGLLRLSAIGLPSARSQSIRSIAIAALHDLSTEPRRRVLPSLAFDRRLRLLRAGNRPVLIRVRRR
jgi:hypothetical protein